MMIALFFAALAVAGLACAYFKTAIPVWTGVIGAVLLTFSLAGEPGPILLVLSWLIFAAVTVPLNYLPWRRQFLTGPILDTFKTMVPQISETEQVALDAGTVGFEGELFSGRPRWSRFIKQPLHELTVEEQAFIDGPVEELCDMIDEWEVSHYRAGLSEKAWEHLKSKGFFGMIIPKEYGGLGFSAVAHRAVLEKVAGISSTVGSVVAVPNSLGPAELLLHYGTQEQKEHYLPRLADGREIPCFGLTSTTAGSDATSIADHGVVCKGKWNGKNVVGIKLNFEKRYITLAPVATVVGLAFRLYDPEGLIGDKEDIGITLALLPSDLPGLDIGRRHFPLNNPFPNGPIRGKDLFIPLDFLLGGEEYIGQGWRMLVESLSVGRAISLPSSATGGAKSAALATGAYARIRKQFNLPIGRFEGVEEALARIAGYTYAMSALSRQTASAVDDGEKPAVPGAIAKYHATEMSREVIKDAMDVHGGKGIILGPKNYLGRAWQGAPIWITVEGANILTRSMMIFGQGAIRCHPYVLKELESISIEDEEERLVEFDRLLVSHVGHSISCAVRSFVLGLSFARFAAVPGDRRTRQYYRKLTRYSAAFALLADVAMLTYGGKLKQKEKISGRLADVLSQLYICSAMLRRFEHDARPAADQPILAWAFHDAIYKIQHAMRGVIDNYPLAWVRPLLRFVVFPLGRVERAPNDRLGHKVASLLLSPSETRNRLTRGIYISDRSGHPIGVMEKLLPDVIAAEPLERKMLKAQRAGQIKGLTFEEQVADAVDKQVLSENERDFLMDVRKRTLEIISVDDFDLAEIQAGFSERGDAARAEGRKTGKKKAA
ncbi:acyl-CoA dehydrogenase [Wenzhouxiangella marina]|uniref:Acyl-coenzyme A dehydrogenase n=1 Tax=Wenzhouxiangella marina TaxID=1579979 RepID=A0A0K0XYZ6_9GAMM|nr:acyl-CoA dehydrogenase [Wenzhouxiangella marina]AKS42895.1 acyl-CoA dehydrogenase [Wenzhouxiangella marina]MBB6087422.1 acyl-CoA dehydrogenase [Wenzhouxiangella marina]